MCSETAESELSGGLSESRRVLSELKSPGKKKIGKKRVWWIRHNPESDGTHWHFSAHSLLSNLICHYGELFSITAPSPHTSPPPGRPRVAKGRGSAALSPLRWRPVPRHSWRFTASGTPQDGCGRVPCRTADGRRSIHSWIQLSAQSHARLVRALPTHRHYLSCFPAAEEKGQRRADWAGPVEAESCAWSGSMGVTYFCKLCGLTWCDYCLFTNLTHFLTVFFLRLSELKLRVSERRWF